MSNEFQSVLTVYNQQDKPQEPPNDAPKDVDKVITQNPELAAVISKKVKKNEKTNLTPSPQTIHQIASNLYSSAKDTDTMLKLFPELKFGCELILSGVSNPDGLKTPIIHFTHENTKLAATLTSGMITIIQQEINGYHKLDDRIEDIFREALVDNGAHVRMVMPESTIDALIEDAVSNKQTSVSVESLYGVLYNNDSRSILNYGFLGNPGKVSDYAAGFENAYSPTTTFNPVVLADCDITIFKHLVVHDNPNIAGIHRLYDAINHNRITTIMGGVVGGARPAVYNPALESEVSLEFSRARERRLQRRQKKYKDIGREVVNPNIPYIQVASPQKATRRSIGRPMDVKIPAHAVIPVHPPGDPTTHIGYFVAYKDGYPLSASDLEQQRNNLLKQYDNGYKKSITEQDSTKINTQLVGHDLVDQTCDGKEGIALNSLRELYTTMIETELTDRLSNGAYGAKFSLGKVTHVYEALLSYALKRVNLTLLYVPGEMMAYVAHKHNTHGVGVSILKDAELLAGTRAVLHYTRSLDAINKSIGSTEVNVTFDENDPDVEGTKTMIANSIYDKSKTYLPQRVIDPSTILDWISKQGLHFTYENHPDLPNTKITFAASEGRPRGEMDTGWYDELKKSNVLSLGVSSELVDASYGGEFATTDLNRNAITQKHIARIRASLFHAVTDYVRKLVAYDDVILTQLRQFVTANLDEFLRDDRYAALKRSYSADHDFIDALITDFLSSLVVDAARADGGDQEALKTTFEAHMEAAEKAFDYLYSEDLLNAMIKDPKNGLPADSVDAKAIRSLYLAHVAMTKMSELNFMPELSNQVNKDTEGNHVDIGAFYKVLSSSMVIYGKTLSVPPQEDTQDAEPY